MSGGQIAGTAEALRHLAVALSDLAGPRGLPEAVQTPADAYPGSTTGNVLYDLGVALSLAVGDFAEEAVAAAALLEDPASVEGRALLEDPALFEGPALPEGQALFEGPALPEGQESVEGSALPEDPAGARLNGEEP